VQLVIHDLWTKKKGVLACAEDALWIEVVGELEKPPGAQAEACATGI